MMNGRQETNVQDALVDMRFGRNPGGSILEDISLVGGLLDEMVIMSV